MRLLALVLFALTLTAQILVAQEQRDSIDSVKSMEIPQSAPKVFAKCVACHGVDGQKIAPGTRGETRIAGLREEKIIADLKGYRAQFTDNGGAKSIMYIQAQNLSDEQILALARYISSLPKYSPPTTSLKSHSHK